MSALQLFKVEPLTVPRAEPGGLWFFVDASGNLCAKNEAGEILIVVPAAQMQPAAAGG